MSDVREPAVAGKFYNGSEKGLESQIEKSFTHQHGPGKVPEPSESKLENILGLVSPHAGYPYSGPVAAHGYSKLAEKGKPEDIIIVGPNHLGFGANLSFDNSEKWRTPFGEVDINKDLRNEILSETINGELDATAHRREHSLEVQLPFLQYLYGNDFEIVPICMKSQDLETSQALGEAIGKVENSNGLLVIASTDLTHYESPEIANEKDEQVLEKIQDMDWKGVNQLASESKHSTCGYGPITATLLGTKELGGNRTEVYKHSNSGEIGGPSREVVGYASVGILKG